MCASQLSLKSNQVFFPSLRPEELFGRCRIPFNIPTRVANQPRSESFWKITFTTAALLDVNALTTQGLCH